MRYEEIKSGEWIRPVTKGYKMQCCDCNLVHSLHFRIVDGEIEFKAFRDDRATNAFRRKKWGKNWGKK